MNKLGLFWRTIRYLTIRQLVFQIWHRLRPRPRLRLPKTIPSAHFITVPPADKHISWHGNTFTFLNQSTTFNIMIDWNYDRNGKLWTYNLNYFDFLNQPNVSTQEGLRLIRAFKAQTDSLRDGLEAYPTSLRIGNWIQFLSRHRVQDLSINAHLFAQTQLLSQRLEYHLAGNHLLENGLALLTSAIYFQRERWFLKATALIRHELNQQILSDGCHNERSPMYHQLLLGRVLDCLIMLPANYGLIDATFTTFLKQKATFMLNWLESVTFGNGDIPLMNDAAFNVAPTTDQLRQKAVLLGLHCTPQEQMLRGESGYRMFRKKRFELFVDTGSVGPDNQPGHAHADTFSWILYVDNSPIVVDSGTSTYQTGNQRHFERSTAAHNTVEVGNQNSSEVWAGFRVGRRASVSTLLDTSTTIHAQHDGYRHFGIIHQRSWSIEDTKITIIDYLLNVAPKPASTLNGTARFHFHPDVAIVETYDGIMANSIQIRCQSASRPIFSIKPYPMAEQFNQLRIGQCLSVTFTETLTTTLTLTDEHSLSDLLLRTRHGAGGISEYEFSL